MHQLDIMVYPRKTFGIQAVDQTLDLNFEQQMKEVQTVTRIIFSTVILIFSFLLQSTMTERKSREGEAMNVSQTLTFL